MKNNNNNNKTSRVLLQWSTLSPSANCLALTLIHSPSLPVALLKRAECLLPPAEWPVTVPALAMLQNIEWCILACLGCPCGSCYYWEHSSSVVMWLIETVSQYHQNTHTIYIYQSLALLAFHIRNKESCLKGFLVTQRIISHFLKKLSGWLLLPNYIFHTKILPHNDDICGNNVR